MLLLASLGLPPKAQPASDFSVSLNVCLPTASLLESTPAELLSRLSSSLHAGARVHCSLEVTPNPNPIGLERVRDRDGDSYSVH